MKKFAYYMAAICFRFGGFWLHIADKKLSTTWTDEVKQIASQQNKSTEAHQ